MGKRSLLVVAAFVLIGGLSLALGKSLWFKGSSPRDTLGSHPAGSTAPRASEVGPSAAGRIPLLDQAAQRNKYLFVFFYRDDDSATEALKKVFQTATAKVADRAECAIVRVTDPSQRPIVEKFEADRAPLPLALAIAPNGAITGGFPTRFEEKDLLGAFATPCTQRCMKALQQNKLVFLCVQSSSTRSNDAAMQGVRDFKSDPQYKEVTEIVVLNPADNAEASFLGDLKITPKTEEAITAFLVPPGRVIAEFNGPTNKQDLVSTLAKAASGSCPGGACGPGGCGPRP